MPRKTSFENKPAPMPQGQARQTRRWEIDLKALTPIYKGSARQDGIDPAYPFRGPSLRGQLRMWWRATRETTSVTRLRDDEHQLFGGVFQDNPRASRVSLGLAAMTSDPGKKSDIFQQFGTDLRYALWVDRDGVDELYHLEAEARLRVTAAALAHSEGTEPSEELLNSVEPALKAMLLFGGSGSRSRRGMGSLWSKELLGSSVAGAADLADMLAALCPSAQPRAWPSLGGVRVAWGPQNHANPARAVDAALKDFKSLRGMKSLGGRNFSGEDRLPEAQEDWLRIRDGRDLDNAFTAALGMPLAYRSSNKHLDGTTMVEPAAKGADRLPSPLHIRPVPLPNGQFAPVILGLQPWYTDTIKANNSRMRRRNKGTLNPKAIDIMLGGLQRLGWTVTPVGGHS